MYVLQQNKLHYYISALDPAWNNQTYKHHGGYSTIARYRLQLNDQFKLNSESPQPPTKNLPELTKNPSIRRTYQKQNQLHTMVECSISNVLGKVLKTFTIRNTAVSTITHKPIQTVPPVVTSLLKYINIKIENNSTRKVIRVRHLSVCPLGYKYITFYQHAC